MFRKPRMFHSLSNIKAQFMVSAIFLIDNCFLVSLERNDLYLTAAVFLCIYCYYKHTARAVSFHSSQHHQVVLLAQFSLYVSQHPQVVLLPSLACMYVHKSGLKSDSFH